MNDIAPSSASASGSASVAKPTRGLARHFGIISAFTMLSRIAGLARDAVLTHIFGAGMHTDAFVMAFTIPNTFRSLVAEGSLTVAFLPVFNEVRQREGDAAARRLLGQAVVVFPGLGTLLAGLSIVYADVLVTLFARGFQAVPGKFELTVQLTQVMFPYLVLISFVALAMGALQAHKHFATSAASPVVFNLIHITSMVSLSQLVEPRILGVALGVLFGGLGQVGIQLWGLRRAGLLVRPVFALSPSLLRILRLMIPAIGGVAVHQINIMVLRFYTSFLEDGAVTYLYAADRFMQLPLGVFSIAVATASLPALSDAHVAGDRDGVVQTLLHALRLAFFIAIPAALGLGVLALPVIATVLQHGTFSARMSAATARTLVAFLPGLIAVSGIRVVAQAFFAMKNTTTPVICGAMGLGTNIILAPILAERFGYVGLATSVSIAAWVQFIVEVVLLRRRIGPLGLRNLLGAMLRNTLLGLVMAVAAYGVSLAGVWSEGFSLHNLAVLAVAIASGALIYGVGQYALRAPEMQELLRIVARRRARV